MRRIEVKKSVKVVRFEDGEEIGGEEEC